MSSLDELLILMEWESLCEGKAIAYALNPGGRTAHVTSGNENCIYGDANTWKWPAINEHLVAQIHQSVRTLRGSLGWPPVEFHAFHVLAPGDKADNEADKNKKSGFPRLPTNAKVTKLANEINRRCRQPGKSTKISVALEVTEGNVKEARSLLRMLRRHKDLLQK